MKTQFLLATLILLAGPALMVRSEPPGQPRGESPSALDQKLLGAWRGGGCDGTLVFHEDGTYKLMDYGPAGSNTAGRWEVRWDALPPTLILTCQSSEDTEEIGTTLTVKLIKLNDRELAIKYAKPDGSPAGRYRRVPRAD